MQKTDAYGRQHISKLPTKEAVSRPRFAPMQRAIRVLRLPNAPKIFKRGFHSSIGNSLTEQLWQRIFKFLEQPDFLVLYVTCKPFNMLIAHHFNAFLPVKRSPSLAADQASSRSRQRHVAFTLPDVPSWHARLKAKEGRFSKSPRPRIDADQNLIIPSERGDMKYSTFKCVFGPKTSQDEICRSLLFHHINDFMRGSDTGVICCGENYSDTVPLYEIFGTMTSWQRSLVGLGCSHLKNCWGAVERKQGVRCKICIWGITDSKVVSSPYFVPNVTVTGNVRMFDLFRTISAEQHERNPDWEHHNPKVVHLAVNANAEEVYTKYLKPALDTELVRKFYRNMCDTSIVFSLYALWTEEGQTKQASTTFVKICEKHTPHLNYTVETKKRSIVSPILDSLWNRVRNTQIDIMLTIPCSKKVDRVRKSVNSFLTAMDPEFIPPGERRRAKSTKPRMTSVSNASVRSADSSREGAQSPTSTTSSSSSSHSSEGSRSRSNSPEPLPPHKTESMVSYATESSSVPDAPATVEKQADDDYVSTLEERIKELQDKEKAYKENEARQYHEKENLLKAKLILENDNRELKQTNTELTAHVNERQVRKSDPDPDLAEELQRLKKENEHLAAVNQTLVNSQETSNSTDKALQHTKEALLEDELQSIKKKLDALQTENVHITNLNKALDSENDRLRNTIPPSPPDSAPPHPESEADQQKREKVLRLEEENQELRVKVEQDNKKLDELMPRMQQMQLNLDKGLEPGHRSSSSSSSSSSSGGSRTKKHKKQRNRTDNGNQPELIQLLVKEVNMLPEHTKLFVEIISNKKKYKTSVKDSNNYPQIRWDEEPIIVPLTAKEAVDNTLYVVDELGLNVRKADSADVYCKGAFTIAGLKRHALSNEQLVKMKCDNGDEVTAKLMVEVKDAADIRPRSTTRKGDLHDRDPGSQQVGTPRQTVDMVDTCVNTDHTGELLVSRAQPALHNAISDFSRQLEVQKLSTTKVQMAGLLGRVSDRSLAGIYFLKWSLWRAMRKEQIAQKAVKELKYSNQTKSGELLKARQQELIMRGQIAELQAQVANLQTSNQDDGEHVQSGLKLLMDDHKRLQEENFDSLHKIQELRNELVQHEDALARSNQLVAKQQREIGLLELKVADNDRRIDDGIEDLKRSYDQPKNDERQNDSEDTTIFQTRIQQLEREVNDRDDEALIMKNKILHLQTEVNELTSKLLDKAMQNQELQQASKESGSDSSKIQMENRENVKRLRDMERTVDRLQDSIDELQVDIKMKEDEIEELQTLSVSSSHSQDHRNYSPSQHRLSPTRNEGGYDSSKALQAENEALRQQTVDLEDQIAELQNQLEDLNSPAYAVTVHRDAAKHAEFMLSTLSPTVTKEQLVVTINKITDFDYQPSSPVDVNVGVGPTEQVVQYANSHWHDGCVSWNNHNKLVFEILYARKHVWPPDLWIWLNNDQKYSFPIDSNLNHDYSKEPLILPIEIAGQRYPVHLYLTVTSSANSIHHRDVSARPPPAAVADTHPVKVSVAVQRAEAIAKSDLFSKPDAYAIIKSTRDNMTHKTQVVTSRDPVWEERFDFKVLAGDTLLCEIWDKDRFTKDDLIGKAQITIGQLDNTQQCILDIMNPSTGYPCGKLFIDLEPSAPTGRQAPKHYKVTNAPRSRSSSTASYDQLQLYGNKTGPNRKPPLPRHRSGSVCSSASVQTDPQTISASERDAIVQDVLHKEVQPIQAQLKRLLTEHDELKNHRESLQHETDSLARELHLLRGEKHLLTTLNENLTNENDKLKHALTSVSKQARKTVHDVNVPSPRTGETTTTNTITNTATTPSSRSGSRSPTPGISDSKQPHHNRRSNSRDKPHRSTSRDKHHRSNSKSTGHSHRSKSKSSRSGSDARRKHHKHRSADQKHHTHKTSKSNHKKAHHTHSSTSSGSHSSVDTMSLSSAEKKRGRSAPRGGESHRHHHHRSRSQSPTSTHKKQRKASSSYSSATASSSPSNRRTTKKHRDAPREASRSDPNRAYLVKPHNSVQHREQPPIGYTSHRSKNKHSGTTYRSTTSSSLSESSVGNTSTYTPTTTTTTTATTATYPTHTRRGHTPPPPETPYYRGYRAPPSVNSSDTENRKVSSPAFVFNEVRIPGHRSSPSTSARQHTTSLSSSRPHFTALNSTATSANGGYTPFYAKNTANATVQGGNPEHGSPIRSLSHHHPVPPFSPVVGLQTPASEILMTSTKQAPPPGVGSLPRYSSSDPAARPKVTSHIIDDYDQIGNTPTERWRNAMLKDAN